VFAAAVVLRPDGPRLPGVRDSKTMTAVERQAAAGRIRRHALAWALGASSVREIDRYNILRASGRAMRRALARLRLPPEYVLLDGLDVPELGCPHDAIVDGDARCLSIAAASVLAKVARDRLMAALGRRYPAFAWEENKGYATAAHLAALDRSGPTRHHRLSFGPVSQLSLW
jgi:ribonuclease HII